MKGLKKAGLVGLTALTLAAPGKGLAQDLQKNKKAIIETLQATSENKDEKAYVAKAAEFKEDSVSVTKTLGEIASLAGRLSEFYTEEELNSKIGGIAAKYPHFDMLSYEVKEGIIKEYFGDYIKSSDKMELIIGAMVLLFTFLIIHHHYTQHKKPRDPSLFA